MKAAGDVSRAQPGVGVSVLAAVLAGAVGCQGDAQRCEKEGADFRICERACLAEKGTPTSCLRAAELAPRAPKPVRPYRQEPLPAHPCTGDDTTFCRLFLGRHGPSPQAGALLGRACLLGDTDICLDLARAEESLLMPRPRSPDSGMRRDPARRPMDPATRRRRDAWWDAACERGASVACVRLGNARIVDGTGEGSSSSDAAKTAYQRADVIGRGADMPLRDTPAGDDEIASLRAAARACEGKSAYLDCRFVGNALLFRDPPQATWWLLEAARLVGHEEPDRVAIQDVWHAHRRSVDEKRWYLEGPAPPSIRKRFADPPAATLEAPLVTLRVEGAPEGLTTAPLLPDMARCFAKTPKDDAVALRVLLHLTVTGHPWAVAVHPLTEGIEARCVQRAVASHAFPPSEVPLQRGLEPIRLAFRASAAQGKR